MSRQHWLRGVEGVDSRAEDRAGVGLEWAVRVEEAWADRSFPMADKGQAGRGVREDRLRSSRDNEGLRERITLAYS